MGTASWFGTHFELFVGVSCETHPTCALMPPCARSVPHHCDHMTVFMRLSTCLSGSSRQRPRELWLAGPLCFVSACESDVACDTTSIYFTRLHPERIDALHGPIIDLHELVSRFNSLFACDLDLIQNETGTPFDNTSRVRPKAPISINQVHNATRPESHPYPPFDLEWIPPEQVRRHEYAFYNFRFRYHLCCPHPLRDAPGICDCLHLGSRCPGAVS